MPLKIAILYPTTVPWIARFLDGVRLYAKQSQNEWHIFGSPPALNSAGESILTLRSMEGWKGDGIMISSNDENELRYARNLKIPVLNLGGGLPNTHGIPRVMVDHYKAGRMAAEHLIERGLVNLAFFGWENQWYSQQRCLGFQDRATESGVTCDILLSPKDEVANLNWSERMRIPEKWLSSLSLPCGIFALHDYRAQFLMEACHEVQLRVPDDIAIIGMDNDETICEHSVPKLTSITRNSVQVGYAAAEFLHRMIKGEPCTSQEILIPPSDVIVRESSDMMYCSDPLVMKAIEYMRKHLRESFNIVLIADHLGISKRTLEMRFSQATNSSPHQYLTTLRINRAQSLLKIEPKKSIEAVAAECGFNVTPNFYEVFKRKTGTTPAGYRAQYLNKQKSH